MPAQINILSAGAVSPGLVKVIEAFRRETGHDVKVTFATAPELRKRLGSGQSMDVVIAPPNVLDELPQTSQAAADRITLGRIGVGIMVRGGVPLPKIASVDEFTHALLNAESIVYNQASTGIYLDKLFDQLGVAAQLKSKSTRSVDFAAVLDHVRKSDGNEIGFGATTVIIENAGKGAQFVGPLPEEIQHYTTYTAALTANAGDQARALLRYLATAAAKAIFTRAGIE